MSSHRAPSSSEVENVLISVFGFEHDSDDGLFRWLARYSTARQLLALTYAFSNPDAPIPLIELQAILSQAGIEWRNFWRFLS